MGDFVHRAVIVTAGDKWRELEDARHEARMLGLQTTELTLGHTNGYASFAVVPEGSKIGWPTHERYTESLEAFVRWLADHLELDAVYVEWSSEHTVARQPLNSIEEDQR